ncbi:MAG TPA: hypothetical protein VHE53_03475 [Patescibacteria group bacterium]|nr:hypothetical protein [Patescibacteria group bacterium]
MTEQLNNSSEELLSVVDKKPVSFITIYRTTYIDASGITLASDRDRPEYVEDINWDFVPNSFKTSPSRYPHGHPHEKPISRLERKRLNVNYMAMLGLVGRVRDAYLEGVLGPDVDKSQPLSLQQSSELLDALRYLPQYLSYRSQNALKPHGELPPTIVVLSNGASGGKGAIEGLKYLDGSNLDSVPNIEDAIAMVEDLGALIGKGKTICVASPEQIRSFLNAVVYGPDSNYDKNAFQDIFDVSEIASLIKFSESFSVLLDEFEKIKSIDRNLAERINELVEGYTTTSALKAVINEFYLKTEASFKVMTLSQKNMNLALERNVHDCDLTADIAQDDFGLGIPKFRLDLETFINSRT